MNNPSIFKSIDKSIDFLLSQQFCTHKDFSNINRVDFLVAFRLI